MIDIPRRNAEDWFSDAGLPDNKSRQVAADTPVRTNAGKMLCRFDVYFAAICNTATFPLCHVCLLIKSEVQISLCVTLHRTPHFHPSCHG